MCTIVSELKQKFFFVTTTQEMESSQLFTKRETMHGITFKLFPNYIWMNRPSSVNLRSNQGPADVSDWF